MKIIVIGAGALGAYFGGRLEETGQDVRYVVRSKRKAEIEENGLSIHSTAGDYVIKEPQSVTELTEVNDVDLVLLAVKGQHLPGTIPTLQELVQKGAKVLPLLNGIEHISVLQKELGEEAVIGGLSFIIATLNEDGHVVHSSAFHDLIFGPLHESQKEFCTELHSIMEKANFTQQLATDIYEKMWEKYMFISAFSGITTATNLSIGPVREEKETLHVTKMLLVELKELANSYGANLTDIQVEQALEKVMQLDEKATSSMHQDRRKGLTLEVDHLHGGAVRLAKAKGLQIPYTETILGMIKPFENR